MSNVDDEEESNLLHFLRLPLVEEPVAPSDVPSAVSSLISLFSGASASSAGAQSVDQAASVAVVVVSKEEDSSSSSSSSLSSPLPPSCCRYFGASVLSAGAMSAGQAASVAVIVSMKEDEKCRLFVSQCTHGLFVVLFRPLLDCGVNFGSSRVPR